MKNRNVHLDQFGRKWSGPYAFTINQVNSIASNLKGVYQIVYNSRNSIQIAYIGIATGDTIRGRLNKHISGFGNWALSRLGDPNNFQFVYYECDEITAKQIESYVILTKKPPFNTKLEYKHFIQNIFIH